MQSEKLIYTHGGYVTTTNGGHMNKKCIRSLIRGSVAITALMLLQACAGAPVQGNSEVTRAFQTSNVVVIKPYTRTIFSSNDF